MSDSSYNSINDRSNTNQITIECLMNTGHYNKYMATKMIDERKEKKENKKEDKKFYRKRVLALTREMYKGNFPNNELQNSFTQYLDNVIEYFKFIDTKDILQEEYIGYVDEDNINDTNDHLNESTLANVNQIMMNKPKKMVTLDTFVKKKNRKPKEEYIPTRKEINLNDPSLKKKGIKEKKKKKESKEQKKDDIR
jgi:hypothetical protein